MGGNDESAVEYPDWLKVKDCVTVSVQVTPNARRSEVACADQHSLRIKVKAPPVEGAANEALRAFMASVLGVSIRSIELVRGSTSRLKVLRISGLNAQEVQRRLSSF